MDVRVPLVYCLTHDGYYREPRCWNGCELLVNWSEPVRDVEAESRGRMQVESADLCREAHLLYGARSPRLSEVEPK